MLAQFHAVVDLTVEVDGEIADLQQRPLHMEQQGAGRQGVVALDDDTPRQREGPVEPCGHDGAAIDFGIEFHQAALTRDFGIGLDAERG